MATGAVLANYTGARANEIAQITLESLRRDSSSGIVYIEITNALGFRVKNRYSERQIPIHPDIADDLWAFAGELGANRERYLFPELNRNHRDGPGVDISRYVNERLLPQVGVKAREKVEHCFRHAFINRLRAARTEKRWIDLLVGHVPKDTAGLSYDEWPPIELLYAEIEKLRFPFKVPAFCRPSARAAGQ